MGNQSDLPQATIPYAIVLKPKHPDRALWKQILSQSLPQRPKCKEYTLKSLLYLYFLTITNETPLAIREMNFPELNKRTICCPVPFPFHLIDTA